MSVSLWCEEADGEQNQNQTALPVRDTLAGSQLRARWDPSASGRRVIQRLLHVEERYAPSALYVSLIQQEPERREELTKWTLQVLGLLRPPEASLLLETFKSSEFLRVRVLMNSITFY